MRVCVCVCVSVHVHAYVHVCVACVRSPAEVFLVITKTGLPNDRGSVIRDINTSMSSYAPPQIGDHRVKDGSLCARRRRGLGAAQQLKACHS